YPSAPRARDELTPASSYLLLPCFLDDFLLEEDLLVERPSHALWRERPSTTSFSSCPARKAGTRLAAMRSGASVLGLRTERACRLRRSKVPNPTRVTFSPLARAPVMV